MSIVSQKLFMDKVAGLIEDFQQQLPEVVARIPSNASNAVNNAYNEYAMRKLTTGAALGGLTGTGVGALLGGGIGAIAGDGFLPVLGGGLAGAVLGGTAGAGLGALYKSREVPFM